MGVRYILVGGIIVLALVSVVTAGRLMRGTTFLGHFENVKVRGPKNAPIHLVVYSDFQCPACKGALPPLEELRGEFSDVMQIEFRHYPLERPHRWALTAASFAECAAEQGKFWEYHDRLYSEQDVWSRTEDPISLFAGYVQELKLDRAKLEQCLENPKTLSQIQQERSIGVKQKVQSTPTFFINGRSLVGSLQLKQSGRAMIQEELKKLNQ